MTYFGRMPVSYITPEGNPAAGYLIQVRSLPNKKRKLEPLTDRLYVSPLDPADLEKPDADLIFYHTMLRKGNSLIVTNGAQTDMNNLRGKKVRNFDEEFSGKNPILESEAVMSDWGYEPDSMSTPRVALVRYPDISFFSIASKNGDGGIGAIQVSVSSSGALGLPTYTEREGQTVSLSVPGSGNIQPFMVRIPLTGNTATEIANELYEFSRPDIIVASAGAVLRNGKWEVDFRNKFNSIEEYEEFAAELK